MRRWILLAVCLTSIGLLTEAVAGSPRDAASGAAIADPLGYCKAAGTRDTVRLLPRNLNNAATAALGLPASAADSEGYFWRCMDGAVLVCAVGANIPCQAKADRTRHNAGAEAYCRDRGNADLVPAYATGHETIYEWRCISGAAVRGKAVAQLDRRGFRVELWHRLARGDAG